MRPAVEGNATKLETYYLGYSLLRCDAVHSGGYSLTFRRNRQSVKVQKIIIIIISIPEFLTSQLWLGNIHLSWDVVINRIRLGGLICSLKSFLQLNMCRITDFCICILYSGVS